MGDPAAQMDDRAEPQVWDDDGPRESPLLVLAAAFAGGMLLGLLTRRRSVTRTAAVVTDDEGPSPRGPRVPLRLASSAGRAAEQAGETWDRILDALLGVAAAKAIEYVGRHVPGFRDEYAKRHAN